MRDCPSLQTPTTAPQLLFALVLLALSAISAPLTSSANPSAIAQVRALGKAALLVQDQGQTTISQNPDRPLIPASTMKLLTALHALDRWGPDHRFATEVYQDSNKHLWIKGLGDPYLVSEELDRLIAALKDKGLKQIAGVGIDASLFSPALRIPGRSSSNNPYDAPLTAVAVNFNTINVRIAAGKVQSAESQTPLTPLARQLARGLPGGRHRINLKTRANALRYAGELIAAKLANAGIRVANPHPTIATVPAGSTLLLRHLNSLPLQQVISSMLKYSTNFVANDLFLLLSKAQQQPLTLATAQHAASRWASERFNWQSFTIDDGAGLSHRNRLSARQLIQTLDAFTPYRHLMPQQRGNPAIRAKTGTLRGVSSYAGYIQHNGNWSSFALLINQSVAYTLRLQVANELAAK